MNRPGGTTRATCAPTRGDDRLTILGVRVPVGQGRTPFALVDVQIDGVALTFAYAALRRDVWELRPPADRDGRPAFIADGDLHARVAAAVVEAARANRAAADHIRTWRRRRVA